MILQIGKTETRNPFHVSPLDMKLKGKISTLPQKWKLPDLDLARGLFFDPKFIRSKYFYDEQGYRLSELLAETPEHYALSAEKEILETHADEIANLAQRAGGWIEPISGASEKSKIIFENIHTGLDYAIADPSSDRIKEALLTIKARYEKFRVESLRADLLNLSTDLFTSKLKTRGIVYLHGDHLGSLDKKAAPQVLKQLSNLTSENGGLLVAVDLLKDIKILEAAVNDRFGVAAECSFHLLKRINEEFNLDLKEKNFRHHAFYNREMKRVETYLQSVTAHSTILMGRKICFAVGEPIHTQNSYKYSLDDIAALAKDANLKISNQWTDSQSWFSLVYFTK